MARNSSTKHNTLKNNMPAGSNNDTGYEHSNRGRYKSLFIDNEKYRTTLTGKFENRKKWVEPDEKKIISSMPCTIIEISVQEGDKVNKSDEMLVMEAMKMQNTLYFPLTGKIKKVNIKTGDKIPKGYIIAEYY